VAVFVNHSLYSFSPASIRPIDKFYQTINESNLDEVTMVKRKLFVVVDSARTMQRVVIACIHQ